MTNLAVEVERTEQPHKLWHMAVRVAVPIVVLGLLWNIADGPAALGLLGNVDWRLITVALILVNLQTIASAWRWHRISGRLGLRISPRQAIGEYYLSSLVNQSLPGGVLGDAARAVRARHQAGLGLAAKAVVIERMAGQIAMFGLLAAGTGWAVLIPGGLTLNLSPAHFGVAAVGFACLIVALWFVLRFARRRWSLSFGDSVKASLVADGAWIEQSVMSGLIVALNLASFSVCALATGTSLGVEAIVVLVPLILCAMLIPTTVAGWGFREGAAAALFPLAGASAAAGFAASLAFGLVILAASLPGLLMLIQKRPHHSNRS